jgi:hypothetical protein
VEEKPEEPEGGAAGPSRAVSPGRRSRRSAGARVWLLFALILLLSLVVAVVWVLPGHVEPVVQIVEDSPPSVRNEAVVPTESETSRARFKREAENALQDYLKLQAVLEAQEVLVWGKQEYEAAQQVLAEADASFANQNFEQATSGYEAAAGMLDQLEKSRPVKLGRALSLGSAALDEYDSVVALDQFEIALAIEPGNKQALAGADRAGKIEQVSHLLDQAAKSEAKPDLEAAQALLQQAVALDPASDRARAELERVGSQIETNRFNQFMSDALRAAENERFDTADKALSSAAAIRPASAEVADARKRIELAIQKKKIDRHRQRAEKLEQSENWHEVASELDAVLAIDPQAQFAVQGLEQSRRLAALHDQLDVWLLDPERLGSRQPRVNARTLLDSPVSSREPGPRLQEKFDQLAALLSLAETPVQVALESDGFTNVIINRVGRFGSFKQKTVDLLPGRYVVRGERAGFRDVRLELNVHIGAATPALVVRCEEKF